ncbi:Glycogen phosphorylase [uncultured Coleofasciculus sp.]|uniref:Glycogen phosphorylase n=1 Tax=uncultured Coleofasciculus sp. TaxID=1267456 RepID=A0A6J4ISC5_9CYAN|nr:Glycogen phosphorylase [uncultured Coleofasciculus sp.]
MKASSLKWNGNLDDEIHLVQFLVSGCDVWLNTPRRLLKIGELGGD